jgi:hypothetical protein
MQVAPARNQKLQSKRATTRIEKAGKIPGCLGLGRRDGMICQLVGLGGRNDHPPSRTNLAKIARWLSAVSCLEFARPASGILEHT